MIPLTMKTFAALMAVWWIVDATEKPGVERFTYGWVLLVVWLVMCAKEIGDVWE